MHDELTASDRKKMEEELRYRKNELRPRLMAEVKRTREYGDLSENYEYRAAKQERNRNDSRIRYLQNMLDTAVMIEKSGPADAVDLFDRVTILAEGEDEEEIYRIVTTIRADAVEGYISKESPLGKALIGRRANETVTVTVNERVSYRATILRIEKCDDADEIPISRF